MSRIKFHKSVAKVIEEARKLGFSAEHTKGDHLKFVKPGRKSVYFGKTPSDRRAYLNAISNIRKSDRGVL